MITDKKVIKISDLSNSKQTTGLNQLHCQPPSSSLFNLQKMSMPPEFEKERIYGVFTDIYNCGQILYALLNGNYPSESDIEMLNTPISPSNKS